MKRNKIKGRNEGKGSGMRNYEDCNRMTWRKMIQND